MPPLCTRALPQAEILGIVGSGASGGIMARELARAADKLFPAQAPYSHLKKENDADPAP